MVAFIFVLQIYTFNSKAQPKPDLTVRSVAGQGVIYAVVVGQGTVSSYVSIATYSCDIQKNGDCQIKGKYMFFKEILKKFIIAEVLSMELKNG